MYHFKPAFPKIQRKGRQNFIGIISIMGFWGWVLYLCHLETLFIIGVILMIIYLKFFYAGKKGVFNKLEDFAEEIVENAGAFTYIDKNLIKPPKAGKRFGKHEERCREIFEDIFKTEFKSVRPKWLENPVTGKPLELDGFNAGIKTPLGKGLAFEYDGAQHAKYTPRFHAKGENEFIYQVKKDSWKDLRCKQERVMLIRIPDFVDYHDLERYIKQQLRYKGMGGYIRGGTTRGAGASMYD
jgi:hypothetical protein